MPRTYLNEEERQEAKIKRLIFGQMKANKVRQRELAELWGCTQRNVSYKIERGKITLLELWKAQELLKLDKSDLWELLGKERV